MYKRQGQKKQAEKDVIDHAFQLIAPPLDTSDESDAPLNTQASQARQPDNDNNNSSTEARLYKGQQAETETAVKSLLAIDPQLDLSQHYLADLTAYREPEHYMTATTTEPKIATASNSDSNSSTSSDSSTSRTSDSNNSNSSTIARAALTLVVLVNKSAQEFRLRPPDPSPPGPLLLQPR